MDFVWERKVKEMEEAAIDAQTSDDPTIHLLLSISQAVQALSRQLAKVMGHLHRCFETSEENSLNYRQGYESEALKAEDIETAVAPNDINLELPLDSISALELFFADQVKVCQLVAWVKYGMLTSEEPLQSYYEELLLSRKLSMSTFMEHTK